MLEPADRIVRDVERVIKRRPIGIQAALHDESVFPAPDHVNLGY